MTIAPPPNVDVEAERAVLDRLTVWSVREEHNLRFALIEEGFFYGESSAVVGVSLGAGAFEVLASVEAVLVEVVAIVSAI